MNTEGNPDQISQPVPVVSSADVERIVHRDYPNNYAEVVTLLEQFRVAGTKERARVHLAILKVADGDATRLPKLIREARRDYRNALAAAEYPHYMRFFGQKLPPEKRLKLYEEDRQQYESWLNRP